MAIQQRRDLRITGNGSATGGIFDRVKIVGDSEIEGSVECSEFRCVGECEVEGSIRAEQLKVTGTLKTTQHLYAETAKFRGEANIRGNVGTDDLNFLGNLNVLGDCEGESLDIKGSFTIDGLLNADTIQVRLYGRSRAREIGGEKINIRKRSKLSRYLMPFIFSGNDPILTAETIEGDEIYLEYTKAGFVRGNNVTIGPGCEIGCVEYKSRFHVDEGSTVNMHQKI